MCGIAGVVSSRKILGPAAIRAMVGAMHHRGPDDSGLEPMCGADPECWLGSTRLAIVDLTAAGHMPMKDPDGGNSIVYNGEVYNFPILRKTLEDRGERFRSRTDTEVILKLYRREGARCVESLRGMFAFAIWDSARRELFLARDRAGKKPLYYWTDDNGTFAFASEVRALLAGGWVDRRLDLEALDIYLGNGFMVSPLTLIHKVRSLMPGHYMRISSDGSVVESRRYWRPRPTDPKTPADPESVRALFQEAVQLRRVADVPVGVFLSGGLDSSAVAAALSQTGPTKTFSIGCDEPEFDESSFSRRVASALRTEHIHLPLSSETFWAWVPDALAAFDQPSYDGLNTYMVSRAARDAGLKVAVSGIGADELFGGYPFFCQARWLAWARRLYGWRGAPAWPLPHSVLRVSGCSKLRELPRFRGRPAIDASVSVYQTSQILFPSWARMSLLEDSVDRGPYALPDAFLDLLESDLKESDRAGQLSLLAWKLFLSERCLRDTDAMSMGVSLEVRAPFTDTVFVEAVQSIPGARRMQGAPNKTWEWLVMRPLIDGVLPFRKKQGFVFPFESWLRAPAGLSMMRDVVADRTLVQSVGLNGAAVDVLVEGFRRGAVPWSRLWTLFILCDWARRNRVTR